VRHQIDDLRMPEGRPKVDATIAADFVE